MTIGTAEHFVRVVIVLPVVFPEADGADFIAATHAERLESAARASERKIADRSHAV
jgi:hypothetical protein